MSTNAKRFEKTKEVWENSPLENNGSECTDDLSSSISCSSLAEAGKFLGKKFFELFYNVTSVKEFLQLDGWCVVSLHFTFLIFRQLFF